MNGWAAVFNSPGGEEGIRRPLTRVAKPDPQSQTIILRRRLQGGIRVRQQNQAADSTGTGCGILLASGRFLIDLILPQQRHSPQSDEENEPSE